MYINCYFFARNEYQKKRYNLPRIRLMARIKWEDIYSTQKEISNELVRDSIVDIL